MTRNYAACYLPKVPAQFLGKQEERDLHVEAEAAVGSSQDAESDPSRALSEEGLAGQWRASPEHDLVDLWQLRGELHPAGSSEPWLADQ